MTPPNHAPPLWELEQHLASLIAEQTGLAPERVRPESRLLEDLGIDSLEFVELVLTLEERFAVTIPDDLGGKLFVRQPFTVAALAAIVRHHWGTGTPRRERWWKAAPRSPERPARPFTQLGGTVRAGEGLAGPLYEALAETEEGSRQWRRRTDGMRCLEIPAAEVELGSALPEAADDERPLHRARLEAFLLDAEPVSVAAFARFLNATADSASALVGRWCGVPEQDRRRQQFQLRRTRRRWEPVAGTERQPMVLVSWFGAAAYSLWAHRLDWRDFELGHRLPSEAQWEYAARGPRSVRYPWGDAPASPALALTDLHRARQRGGSILPLAGAHEPLGLSPFGAGHMAGNVWNWCADWYAPDFYRQPEASQPDPRQDRVTGIRAERGGSWVGPAELARSSFRRGRPPAAVGRCLGFRCAASLRGF